MNVFELINEKLEEAKQFHLNLADAMIDIQANGTGRHYICLEDAISIVDEVAQEYNKNKHTDEYIKGYNQGTVDRADEIQKAREYGYNKAIDEFAEKMNWSYQTLIDNGDCSTNCKACLEEVLKSINEIAEQLKGGSDER